MRCLIDKISLFALSFLLLYGIHGSEYMVLCFLGSAAVSFLNSYLEREERGFLNFAYCLFCFLKPGFLVFLPPVVYCCAGCRHWYFRFCWLLALLVPAGERDLAGFFSITVFCGLAFLLAHRTAAFEETRKRYFEMEDITREKALHLEQKNRELMEKQDYEIRLATLGERNRIAREIHDNVGHLLTRSLLQVSAMEVIHKEDGALTEQLVQVKGTLSEAMDSVRKSVHDLHEEAVDLEEQLRQMAEAFTFCPVTVHYRAGEAVPKQVRYCFIAIAREGLSNIARHSNASRAEISVICHPAVYQMVIRDNGTINSTVDPAGIGLQNIRERVGAIGGIFRVEKEQGFRLFVSVPRGGKE